nr:MAG TPA: hypothetical protein [Bacteriophage sp.]
MDDCFKVKSKLLDINSCSFCELYWRQIFDYLNLKFMCSDR